MRNLNVSLSYMPWWTSFIQNRVIVCSSVTQAISRKFPKLLHHHPLPLIYRYTYTLIHGNRCEPSPSDTRHDSFHLNPKSWPRAVNTNKFQLLSYLFPWPPKWPFKTTSQKTSAQTQNVMYYNAFTPNKLAGECMPRKTGCRESECKRARETTGWSQCWVLVGYLCTKGSCVAGVPLRPPLFLPIDKGLKKTNVGGAT